MEYFIILYSIGGTGSHVGAAILMLMYPQVQHSIISKMALLSHKQDESLQPGYQFCDVFVTPRGDQGSNQEYVRPKSKAKEKKKSQKDHGSTEELNDTGLIGGSEDLNTTFEDFEMHGGGLSDSEHEDPIEMAIRFLNARVTRFRNRNRLGNMSFCWYNATGKKIKSTAIFTCCTYQTLKNIFLQLLT